MSSLTTNIFVNENENIFEVMLGQGIVPSDELINHLIFISNKTSNNYIGYYQFMQNDVYYKIYILPKTTPKVKDEKENKKNFIAIMSKYYELKFKYGVKFKSRNRNIVDFAIDNEKVKTNSDSLDDFIAYKYNDALQTIKLFFKRHYKSKNKKQNFYSQSIKYQFDLKQNITELDKSKIHQNKNEPYLYSQIAQITIDVLEHFIKHKKSQIKEAKKLKNRISSKYTLSKNYFFKTKEITSNKVLKLFKSSDEKELYLALLMLLGIESYFEDKNHKEIIKLYNQHSHFFRPEELFEWIVYDDLIGKYGKKNVQRQQINTYQLAGVDRNSKPDFVVIVDEEKIVIDVKWKILKSLKDIKFEDAAKLRRDTLLIKGTKAELIYPHIEFLDISGEYELSVDRFRFIIKTIGG